jgi:hypothetical protein
MPTRKQKTSNKKQKPKDDSKKKKKQKDKFVEARVKWKHSKAKSLLERDLREGRVPLEILPGKRRYSMRSQDVYDMHPESKLYDPDKFPGRLASLRKQVLKRNSRAEDDEKALQVQAKNYDFAIYTYDGFIQWQGSNAQELLWEDMEKGEHRKLGKKDLWASRPEYYENFPLGLFRDKLYQETRTAKYIYTLNVKGKQHKAS